MLDRWEDLHHVPIVHAQHIWHQRINFDTLLLQLLYSSLRQGQPCKPSVSEDPRQVMIPVLFKLLFLFSTFGLVAVECFEYLCVWVVLRSVDPGEHAFECHVVFY